MSGTPEFRGIGDVYARTPIGAVLQIGWRRKRADSDQWDFAGSFGAPGNNAVRCFNIMTTVTDNVVKRGTYEAPCRSPHPSFTRFNRAHPSLCMAIKAVLVNSKESDVYRKKLGAFRAPQKPGQKSPAAGWWCQGDGQNAQRFVDGKFQPIVCPGTMCEFQQEGSGPKGKGQHCKCNLSLVAQFRWQNGDLPEVVFQWDSKGWTNAGYLDGLFKQVDEAALLLGYKPGTFPLIGLPIVMQLAEKTKPGNRYPIVSVSVEGNLFGWMKAAHQLAQSGKRPLPPPEAQPRVLELSPPEGYSQDDMERAREASLNPNYSPANERPQ